MDNSKEINVRDTYWGKKDKENFDKLVTVLPDVLETYYQEWENRINGIRDDTDRTQISVISAQELIKEKRAIDGKEEDVWTQSGKIYTFFVTTQAGKSYVFAYDTVTKHLKSMYPNTYWAVWARVNTIYALKG